MSAVLCYLEYRHVCSFPSHCFILVPIYRCFFLLKRYCFCSFSVSYLLQSFTEGELQRVIRSLVDRKVGRRTKRAKSIETCSLHQVVLTVSELGLGYESDETVRFRYCRGKCTRRLGNYDMVLKNVILSKAPERDVTTKGNTAKKERPPYSRCCRPTKYENMSFFDNKAKFFTIQDVSARKCSCVWWHCTVCWDDCSKWVHHSDGII